MFSAMSDELRALAGYEACYQISLFDSLLPDIVLKRYPLQGITADMVYAATMSQPFQGRLLSEWAEGLETDRITRIVNAVRHGYLQGETTEAIARRVRGHANKGYKDGALQMSRANATSIVKSAVNHLAATARQSFAKANSDVIECKQWLSTLDNKTTPLCMIRDRRKYTLENKPIGHKMPYLQGPGRIHFVAAQPKRWWLNHGGSSVLMPMKWTQEPAPVWTVRYRPALPTTTGYSVSHSPDRFRCWVKPAPGSFVTAVCVLMSSTPIKGMAHA